MSLVHSKEIQLFDDQWLHYRIAFYSRATSYRCVFGKLEAGCSRSCTGQPCGFCSYAGKGGVNARNLLFKVGFFKGSVRDLLSPVGRDGYGLVLLSRSLIPPTPCSPRICFLLSGRSSFHCTVFLCTTRTVFLQLFL